MKIQRVRSGCPLQPILVGLPIASWCNHRGKCLSSSRFVMLDPCRVLCATLNLDHSNRVEMVKTTGRLLKGENDYMLIDPLPNVLRSRVKLEIIIYIIQVVFLRVFVLGVALILIKHSVRHISDCHGGISAQ